MAVNACGERRKIIKIVILEDFLKIFLDFSLISVHLEVILGNF